MCVCVCVSVCACMVVYGLMGLYVEVAYMLFMCLCGCVWPCVTVCSLCVTMCGCVQLYWWLHVL